MHLVTPSLPTLPGFVDALERGWSPDNVRGAEAAHEQLEAIKRDSPPLLPGSTRSRPRAAKGGAGR